MKAPSVLGLDDPQFFGPIRSEVVEGFSITFADIHIQIMVGDDVNAITGDVGGAQRVAESDGVKGNSRMPKDVMGFGFRVR